MMKQLKFSSGLIQGSPFKRMLGASLENINFFLIYNVVHIFLIQTRFCHIQQGQTLRWTERIAKERNLQSGTVFYFKKHIVSSLNSEVEFRT